MDDNGEIVEELTAKKKDDLAGELKKCPKIQAKMIDILKGGLEDEPVFASSTLDADLSDEEFETKLMSGELDDKIVNEAISEAEEETGWEEL